MKPSSTYTFSANIWQYPGKGGWFFMSLPVELSKKIRAQYKEEEQGWGRLSVHAVIGATSWETAIWFDTKQATYLLPVKKEIRLKEKITDETMVHCTFKIK